MKKPGDRRGSSLTGRAASLAKQPTCAGQGPQPCLEWVLLGGDSGLGTPTHSLLPSTTTTHPPHTHRIPELAGHVSRLTQVEMASRSQGPHGKLGPCGKDRQPLGMVGAGHTSLALPWAVWCWAGPHPGLVAPAHSALFNPLNLVNFSLSPKSRPHTELTALAEGGRSWGLAEPSLLPPPQLALARG